MVPNMYHQRGLSGRRWGACRVEPRLASGDDRCDPEDRFIAERGCRPRRELVGVLVALYSSDLGDFARGGLRTSLTMSTSKPSQSRASVVRVRFAAEASTCWSSRVDIWHLWAASS